MNRYARQTILPAVGADGQRRLAAASIVVIGAGGLAAPALPLLAGAGVGRITIVDNDHVSLTNLHRQTLFHESDCGQPKAKVAAARCAALNAEISVWPLVQNVTPANVAEVVGNADLVLDCADSFAASYLLSDHCLGAGVPLISASALGMAGYVGGFCGGAPSLRAVFPDAPDSGASCDTAGVLGPVVTILGALQAQMALQVILGFGPSPLGQLVQFDGTSLATSSFRFDTAPEPARPFPFLSPQQLSPTDLIVELRSSEEAPTPLHPMAQRLAVDDIAPLDAPRVALCCATGLRAWRAAETLSTRWHGEIVLVAAATS